MINEAALSLVETARAVSIAAEVPLSTHRFREKIYMATLLENEEPTVGRASFRKPASRKEQPWSWPTVIGHVHDTHSDGNFIIHFCRKLESKLEHSDPDSREWLVRITSNREDIMKKVPFLFSAVKDTNYDFFTLRHYFALFDREVEVNVEAVAAGN